MNGYLQAMAPMAGKREGVSTANILQVWLDVAAVPARGPAQTDELRKSAVSPLFKEVLA